VNKVKTIAVVDDEQDIVDIVSFYLEKEGFKTRKFFDGESFYKALKKDDFDAVILDLMLPGIDGVSLIEVVRKNENKSHLPIIVLTAKSSESDIVSVLESGADSYITKPFSGKVLAARVKALLRNKSARSSGSFESISIDNEQFKVFCKDRETLLTKTEFKILSLLLSRPGKVFTRPEFLDIVWGGNNEEPFDRSIDVHIRHIRKKLGECGNYIKTVRGIGYKIEKRP
jgi:two-component system alkaline phosphatase synthesis response regulator PhoP